MGSARVARFAQMVRARVSNVWAACGLDQAQLAIVVRDGDEEVGVVVENLIMDLCEHVFLRRATFPTYVGREAAIVPGRARVVTHSVAVPRSANNVFLFAPCRLKLT